MIILKGYGKLDCSTDFTQKVKGKVKAIKSEAGIWRNRFSAKYGNNCTRHFMREGPTNFIRISSTAFGAVKKVKICTPFLSLFIIIFMQNRFFL